jgi:hypothetical protein
MSIAQSRIADLPGPVAVREDSNAFDGVRGSVRPNPATVGEFETACTEVCFVNIFKNNDLVSRPNMFTDSMSEDFTSSRNELVAL